LRRLGGPLLDAEIDILCCKTLGKSNCTPNLQGVVITGSADEAQNRDPAPHSRMPSLPAAIMSFQSLVILVFRFVDFGGDKWLPNLGRCCPHLKSLMLLRCTGYTVKAIQTIVEARMESDEVKSLESLRINTGWGERAGAASDDEAAWFERVLKFNSRGVSWYEIDEYD
ncbi:hypothetical protein FRC01_008800, partial [Tulasnella sp. 417]